MARQIVNNRFPHRNAKLYSVSLLAYVGIAALVTMPMLVRLTTHLPDGTDTLVHYWNAWWAGQAWRTGQSPYFTPYLSYPDGLSMVYHNFAWLHILPSLALKPVLGGIAAYNVTFLVHLGLCGWAFFLLAGELVGNRRAAFVGGLIYECWPQRLSQTSHPNMVSTWGIPLFVLCLARVARRGRWQDGLLAGVCLALVGYTRWQLLIPAVLLGSLYMIAALPGHLNRRSFLALLLGAGVAVAALAPPILLLAREWRANPADLILESEEFTMNTDVLAYLTPPPSQPVLGALTQAAYDRYYHDRGSRRNFSAYLGAATLLLALVGVWKSARRDTLPWIGGAAVFILLALGPVLRFGGQFYPSVPMPYNFAALSGLVRLMREPDRFNFFLALPFAMLATHGLTHGLSRVWRRQPASIAFLGLAGSAIFFEYLAVPFPLQPIQVSSFYTQLAAETEPFAVLDIPANPYKSKPYMLAQVTHHHPILFGHASRYPQAAFRYLETQAWLRAMRQFDEVPPKQRDISRQLNALANDHVRYLIVHKDMVGDQRWSQWERYLALSARFEDAEIAVFTTIPQAGRDFSLNPELFPGLGIVRTLSSTTCLNPGSAFEIDVAWGASAPPGRDLAVELALGLGTIGSGTGETFSQIFPITRDWPAREWPANTLVWEYYTVQVPLTLTLGTYAVSLVLVDQAAGTSLRQAVEVGTVEVQAGACLFASPPGAAEANVRFGDAMRLTGYHVRREADALLVTLHWRSERRMEVDYKVFVHVFEPATGSLVAQDDAMPLQWRYPTTLWGPGERVTDTISIPLEETGPSRYGVAVGIYDPATMERLPAVDGNGRAYPDGRLVLQVE